MALGEDGKSPSGINSYYGLCVCVSVSSRNTLARLCETTAARLGCFIDFSAFSNFSSFFHYWKMFFFRVNNKYRIKILLFTLRCKMVTTCWSVSVCVLYEFRRFHIIERTLQCLIAHDHLNISVLAGILRARKQRRVLCSYTYERVFARLCRLFII